MLVLMAVACTALGACSPTAAPSPTPTAAFASEEEAFAAAEETYRAYIDALSDADMADSSSLERVYDWLQGDAESTSRETFSELSAEGYVISGPTKYENFTGTLADTNSGQVQAGVCLDVGDVDVLNEDGHSIVSDDRPDHQSLSLVFLPASTPTGLAIASTQPSDVETCTPSS